MTLNGYDISASQDGIDPAVVPCDFVQVKITGGDGYVNPNWQDEVAKVRAAGKLLGIYHFARDGYTNATAHSEAQWFLQHAAGLIDGTVIVVLDWEGDNVTDVAYAKAWLDEVTAATGVKPLIYISFKDINGADWTPVAAADYGLWEAAYVLGYQKIYGYLPPAGRAPIPYWNTIAEWQYTSSGNIPGWSDNLDLDVFYGDASTWAAYAAKNGTLPQETDVVTQADINAIAQAAADEVLNRTVNREGPAAAALGPSTNLRAVLANFDSAVADVKGTVDADVKGISVTLTDAQLQTLGADVAAKLPANPTKDDYAAAVIAALKVQANK